MNNFEIVKPVKVGVIQLEVYINQYSRNIAKALEMIDVCANEKCDLICLPEAFPTSINLPKGKTVSEEFPGETTNILSAKAREYGVYLVAGIMEKNNQDVYSSALLFGPDGNIFGKYRRNYIYQLEKRFITQGNSIEVFDTSIGRIGMIIGYDINFPEICRTLFIRRVEIIVCPSQLISIVDQAVKHLAIARAAENNCYFILPSSVGENTLARMKYMGNSMIVQSPIGLDVLSTNYIRQKEVIAKADYEETIIYGTLDIRKLRRNQQVNSHYDDIVNVNCQEEIFIE